MTTEDDSATGRRSEETPSAPVGVSKRDENAPVAAGDGQDSREELTWGLQHIPAEPGLGPGDQPVPGISVPADRTLPEQEEKEPEKPLLSEHAGHLPVKDSPEIPAEKRPKQKFVEKVVRGPGKQRRGDKPDSVPGKQRGTVDPAPGPVDKKAAVNTSSETVKEVFRKTELHAAPPVIEEDTELKALRKKMILKLKRPKCEVSYLSYETAFREFIASLMVRQDRTDAELRPQIAALWDQVRVLEKQLDWKTARLGQRMDELEERERY